MGITAFTLRKGELSVWEEGLATRAADFCSSPAIGGTKHYRERSFSLHSRDSIPVQRVPSEPLRSNISDVQSLSGSVFRAQSVSPAPGVVPNTDTLF